MAHQASLSLEFSRQEYWGSLPFPIPGDLPHPGIQPMSLALADGFFFFFFLTTEPPGKPHDPVLNPGDTKIHANNQSD